MLYVRTYESIKTNLAEPACLQHAILNEVISLACSCSRLFLFVSIVLFD
jgi:hypothetical protein